jgi:hypothetical protein
MECLFMQFGQGCVRSGNLQRTSRGYLLVGLQAIFGMAIFNSGSCGELLDVHGNCQSTSLEYTTESTQSEPHSKPRGYACDRISVTRLSDAEVKISEMSQGRIPDLTDPKIRSRGFRS